MTKPKLKTRVTAEKMPEYCQKGIFGNLLKVNSRGETTKDERSRFYVLEHSGEVKVIFFKCWHKYAVQCLSTATVLYTVSAAQTTSVASVSRFFVAKC